MASLDCLVAEAPKKKRKRVSAKFRRLTKERRQANARERDRANALRTAFLSLEGSLPQELKDQLPTRFGTMLAAILYIGHLTELVSGGESPALEVANRAACRRYQGLAGEEQDECISAGSGLEDEHDTDDQQQVELKLASDSVLTSSLLVSTSRLPNSKQRPSPSVSSAMVLTPSPSSSDSASNSSGDNCSDPGYATTRCSSSSSALSPLEEMGLGFTAHDFFTGSLFTIPDLGPDDLFADMF